ncbi:MAG: hypothetical protein AAF488_03195 [Planctomycetota bacterium]
MRATNVCIAMISILIWPISGFILEPSKTPQLSLPDCERLSHPDGEVPQPPNGGTFSAPESETTSPPVTVRRVGSNALHAQSNGELRRPLDLPSPGAGDDEDDEDAPESITFYGSEYEGDAFFWCLDRSGSMSVGGQLETLKAECTRSINQLSARAEFSVVSFSSNHSAWSSTPRRANSGNKSSAISWVNSLVADGWTCLATAGVATIQIANLSSKQRKQILILGDGEPICGGTDTSAQSLISITSANYEQIPIHCLLISTGSQGASFFQQLALQNGGTFTLIQ